MSESTKSTESKTESTSTSTGYGDEGVKPIDDSSKTNDDVNKNNESELDEYGYKESDNDSSSDENKEKKPEVKPEESKEVETKATGYEDSDKEKKPEVKPEEKSKSDEEKLTQTKTDITESLKDLPEGYSKEKVLDFAIKNGLSNDQVKAYIEMEKAAAVDYQESQESAKTVQQKAFKDELKLDATFGGENFDQSVKHVETVLEKHFPNFKKTLTDRGGMVPPYIMKDLLALHKVLNPTTTLVGGSPIIPEAKDDGNFLDDMYT